jgi:hypothetical protein
MINGGRTRAPQSRATLSLAQFRWPLPSAKQFPVVVGRLGNSHPPTHIGNWLSHLRLTQRNGDLLARELRPLHQQHSSVKSASVFPVVSHSQWIHLPEQRARCFKPTLRFCPHQYSARQFPLKTRNRTFLLPSLNFPVIGCDHLAQTVSQHNRARQADV